MDKGKSQVALYLLKINPIKQFLRKESNRLTHHKTDFVPVIFQLSMLEHTHHQLLLLQCKYNQLAFQPRHCLFLKPQFIGHSSSWSSTGKSLAQRLMKQRFQKGSTSGERNDYQRHEGSFLDYIIYHPYYNPDIINYFLFSVSSVTLMRLKQYS